MFSDNQAAIALTRDHQFRARTKHMDMMRYHWIRWVIKQGSLRLVYCSTDDMVAKGDVGVSPEQNSLMLVGLRLDNTRSTITYTSPHTHTRFDPITIEDTNIVRILFRVELRTLDMEDGPDGALGVVLNLPVRLPQDVARHSRPLRIRDKPNGHITHFLKWLVRVALGSERLLNCPR